MELIIIRLQSLCQCKDSVPVWKGLWCYVRNDRLHGDSPMHAAMCDWPLLVHKHNYKFSAEMRVCFSHFKVVSAIVPA